ncbi:FAD-dependent monooxygenase [Streptomyces sulphureus]|uniref:FAD-dependent monooxygenase n=1 Tax=Streptomyces sulphureus TaxID=47758 RepID=UPI0003A8F8FF|nr:FAD-dependent monooxygenase [Streptomyces sulphureus]
MGIPYGASRTSGSPRALVIGAGVGGLTAAAILADRGWSVTVLEQAAELEPVGAGISLAPNALRALDIIGLGDAVRALRTWTGRGGLRAPSGRWLVPITGDSTSARFGDPLVLLTRTALVDLLRSRLPAHAALRTGTKAVLADPGGPERPALVTAGAQSLEADLVVAADGIHSATRRTLFPDHPGLRYAGFTTWRFLTDAPPGGVQPHETWGRGRMWGTQTLPDGRVYAYAAAAQPAAHHARDDEPAMLRRLFSAWHPPVPQLLETLPQGAVLRNDVHHLAAPLPAHHHGRVVLLGDAAHPMTPSMGQGGNQAIEDAVVLGQLADPAENITLTPASYTRLRLPRTTKIVQQSARAARTTTLTSAPACALRNAAFALVGRLAPALMLRALDGIADWRPPERV